MLVTQLLNCKNITDKLMTIQADFFFFMEDLLDLNLQIKLFFLFQFSKLH